MPEWYLAMHTSSIPLLYAIGSVLGPYEFTAYTDATSTHTSTTNIWVTTSKQLIDSIRVLEINVTIEWLRQCLEEINRRCA